MGYGLPSDRRNQLHKSEGELFLAIGHKAGHEAISEPHSELLCGIPFRVDTEGAEE
jgi:hypothetical protein